MKRLLDHELSPGPLLGVILGLWLPVEWLYGTDLLRGASLLESAQAIASSVVFNFGFFGLVFAGMLTLVALGTARLARRKGGDCVRAYMDFSIWMIGLALVAETLKRAAVADHPMPKVLNLVILLAVLAAAVALTLRGPSPRTSLRLPILLGLALVPPALVLVVTEGMGLGHAPAPRPGAADGKRPDILFITVDALSARNMSLYGYGRDTTPHLQAFARNATTLDHFYANANWTRPGIASLLNGVRPWTHAGDLERPLPNAVQATNLVLRLAEAGYHLQTVSTNPFSGPYAQGIPGSFQEISEVYWNPLESRFDFRRWPSLARGLAMGPANRISLAWLARTRASSLEKTLAPIVQCERLLSIPAAGPRFTWLHLMTAHDPYAAPAPFMGMFEPSGAARNVRDTQPAHGFAAGGNPAFPHILEGRYDEAVRCLDGGLERLFSWMKARNRFDRTLIVITSDHGESFSHGYGIHGGPLLSEDLLWIPCLIKLPFQKDARRETRLMEQVDLAPTLLDLTGLPVPSGMEGHPMGSKPEGLPAFAMNRDLRPGTRTFSLAVRKGPWKYVEHFGQWDFPWAKVELYDLDRDPREGANLAGNRPDIASSLRPLILEQLRKRGLSEVPR